MALPPNIIRNFVAETAHPAATVGYYPVGGFRLMRTGNLSDIVGQARELTSTIAIVPAGLPAGYFNMLINSLSFTLLADPNRSHAWHVRCVHSPKDLLQA